MKDNKKLKRVFAYLVGDGVLTPDEKKCMVALIDRRNSIAHHLDQVTADLSTDRHRALARFRRRQSAKN